MISDYQRYKYEKHCIQEAIFEAKFSTENFGMAVPGLCYEKVRHEFPETNDLKTITVTLGAAPPDTPPIVQQAPIMQMWNDKRTECLQLGPGIISANILNYSYQGWDSFTHTIDLLLKSYLQSTHPQSTKRVGLRYINRFIFPETNVILSDYFNLNINLPTVVSNINAFDLNVINNYNYEGYEITTKLRFSSDALKPDEQGVASILDIDSFVINKISVDYQEIMKITKLCHEYLKAVFEGTLQDKTRALLGGVKI